MGAGVGLEQVTRGAQARKWQGLELNSSRLAPWHKRESHGKMEAEIGVALTQGKKYQPDIPKEHQRSESVV